MNIEECLLAVDVEQVREWMIGRRFIDHIKIVYSKRPSKWSEG